MVRRILKPMYSIQNKFLLSSLILIIIPLGLFGIIALKVSNNAIASQVSQSNLKTLAQINDKVDMLLNDIVSISNLIYLSGEVNHAFRTSYDPNSYDYLLQRKAIEQLLSNSIHAFDEIKYKVYVLGFNGLRYPSELTKKGFDLTQFQHYPWYEDAFEGRGRIEWITSRIPEFEVHEEHESALYAVRVSKRFETGVPTGIVAISVEQDTVLNLYEEVVDQDQNVIIVNEKGEIISSVHHDQLSTSIGDYQYFQKIIDYDSGYFMTNEHGEKQVVTFQTVEGKNWKIISYVPTSALTKGLNQLKIILIVLFFLVLVLAYCASYFLAKRLAIPIKRLAANFAKVEIGNLSVRSNVQANDEVGLLARKFNSMIDRIESLVSEVKREQSKKRQAELQALQSQINPHFLYNTLTSIRFMLYKHSPEQIDGVIVSLVKLLKQSISKQDELIPINEEIELVKNYLHIQQIRQGEQLVIKYDIAEDILSFRTLKLILQPIVENSIFHGLEPKTEGIRELYIKGYVYQHDIYFEIIDNGVGMNEHVESLQQPSSENIIEHKGGLRNVHERLQLYFGASYGVKVAMNSNAGTIVTVKLPAIYRMEGEAAYEDPNRG